MAFGEGIFASVGTLGLVKIAGYTNASNENVLIGTGLPSNSGDKNVSIGFNNLTSNTVGANNISIGYHSLYSNTSGNFNIGIGYQSLYSNTSGYVQIAIGVAALTNITTGSYNIAIGYGAGQNYTSSESYNIILGASGVAGDRYMFRVGTGTTNHEVDAIVANLTSPYTISFAGSVAINVSQSSLAGTTAGTVTYSEPFVGSSYKKVILYFNGYENDTTTAQSITFPTAFSTINTITFNNTGLSFTLSTTTLTITAPNNTSLYTGLVIIEGW